MNNKAWHISYISAMVGPCAATTDCGMMAWGDNGYSVRLLDMGNDGEKLLLHIDPKHTDELKIYQLVGYAANCDLPYSITAWAEFIEDEEQEISTAFLYQPSHPLFDNT